MARKKTEMNMIRGANARQVSFSKRRSGIFKKASELCTLCAVETALVIFSPAGKAFTFGHPCFETIMKKLIDSEDSDALYAQHMTDHEATLRELNNQYSDTLQKLEAEKKRGEELKRMTPNHPALPLLKRPIDELNLNELETLKSFLEQVRANLVKALQERLSIASTSSSADSAQSIDLSITDQKGTSADTHDDGGCK